jgi:ribosomal protein S18 acetylase RimI-like enzyme
MTRDTMTHTRLTDTEHRLFAGAWELYLRSFPREERRGLRTQRGIMDNPRYHFEVVTQGATPVGIVLWWEFADVRYVEHLATAPGLRGQGLGGRVLRRFTARSEVPVLLEVEHPADEVSRRRVGFYERAGFVPSDRPYSHPPYRRGGERVPLMLMSWPEGLTDAALARFIDHHHPVIHAHVLNG